MADSDLYDSDILAWSEEQAAALRGLTGRPDLPNQLDLAHIAEEIEDVGTSERNSVASLAEQILTHALKALIDPFSVSAEHWKAEIETWQGDLERRFGRSMNQRIDIGNLWRRSVNIALRRMRNVTEPKRILSAELLLKGSTCPVSLEELARDYDSPEAVIARLADAFPALGAAGQQSRPES
jgi:hypothetical protein